jgi:tetratricopeptide (TPR) repeat protein
LAKRSGTSVPSLKHLAFFEALSEHDEKSPSALAATAGLLSLRMVDHWLLAGSIIVEPESVSVQSARAAIMELPAADPQREVLLGLVNTMQSLREVDALPILPRLFAYAGLLEKRGQLAVASDVYETVARLGEEQFESDLLIDAHMRLGFCRRMLGQLDDAEVAYSTAGKIAKRRKEPSRFQHSRVGVAKVALARGNLPVADTMLQEIVSECAAHGFEVVHAMALHDNAVVARMRGEYTRAVCLAYDALERTQNISERERVLMDISGTFVSMGRFEEAETALLIQDATANTSEVRCYARVSLMSLAARRYDRTQFDHFRKSLNSTPLPPDLQVNFLIESARGERAFGSEEEAIALLESALNTARSHGLNRAVFEAEEMIATPVNAPIATERGEMQVLHPDPAAYVVDGLRRMLATVTG